MHLSQRIVSGTAADIRPAVKRKIASFVEIMDTLHRLAMSEVSVSNDWAHYL